MATSNEEENETKIDETTMAGLREFLGKEEEEDMEEYQQMNQRTISMFCKSCLHPYTGQQKSNAIVLRCERCGQTDTILEEDAVNLKPEEWQGNLVLNRFVQVIKEQEELRINISDPFYADDDYQRYHLAVAEFAFNMKLVAEQVTKLLRTTKEAHRRTVNAQRNAKAQRKSKSERSSTGSCADSAEPLNPDGEVTDDDKNSTKANEATSEGAKAVPEDKQTDEASYESSDDDFDFEFPKEMREKLAEIEPTFLQLMKDLLLKYNLPADILDGVSARIQDPSKFIGDSDDESDDDEPEHKTQEATSKKKSELRDTTEATGATDEAPKDDNADDDAGDENGGCNGNKSKSSKKGRDKEYMPFQITKQAFEDTFYGALRSKFDLSFQEGRKIKIGSDDEDESDDDTDSIGISAQSEDQLKKLDADKKAANDGSINDADTTGSSVPDVKVEEATIPVEGSDVDKPSTKSDCRRDEDIKAVEAPEKDLQTQEGSDSVAPINTSLKDEDGNCHNDAKASKQEQKTGDDTSDVKQSEIDNSESHDENVSDVTSPDGNDPCDSDSDIKEENQGSPLGNFHILCSAFIREMQDRKQEALHDRKTKALAVVYEKVDKLKKEVASAEEKAKEELTRAYENKKRKIENQRRQLDKKHEEIKEMESRMQFYARTGQRDKLLELVRQFNSDYDTTN